MTLDGEGRVRTRRARIAVIGMLSPLTLGACATTGATLGSGVGDAFLEHPPYYAGADQAAASGREVQVTGHIPIAYQRGATQASIFDPSVTDAMTALLAEMNGYLDSLSRLAVARPSPEWSEWMGETMTEAGVERALVITLEVGQYRVRQRGLLGHKEVELGTAHVVDLPWLTSLETPVTVVQLTGALVGRDGKAVRIGAELALVDNLVGASGAR